MTTLYKWWENDPEERYWLESTERSDIGSDLNAPLNDGGGHNNWRYTLFHEARIGDIVFHYDKNRLAITSYSRIASGPTDSPITWVAHGKHARKRGEKPEERPGYKISLSDHTILREPLTLKTMRDAQQKIESILNNLSSHGPLYFPFEVKSRQLNPIQGYAFKLPLAFVELFPVLRDPNNFGLIDKNLEIFQTALRDIEAAAHLYELRNLQAYRAKNRKLQRSSKKIFSTRIGAKDWTFHIGGRDELQFNIGIDRMPDGTSGFRAGVAFSLEPSRSLPDITVLLQKIANFNSWMRERPEALSDLSMWHWQDNIRSSDYSPGPIPEALVRPHTFIFLGRQQPVRSIDPDNALKTLDRLLPLYKWVETADNQGEDRVSETRSGFNEETDQLGLGPGRALDDNLWKTASISEKKINVLLRHKEIQRQLLAILPSEGCVEPRVEVQVGNYYIDVIANHGTELWFYEVKTASTARACLREAIGQLLDYALWPGAQTPDRLIVVGEPAIDAQTARYIEILNKFFEIPIAYRQLALRD